MRNCQTSSKSCGSVRRSEREKVNQNDKQERDEEKEKDKEKEEVEKERKKYLAESVADPVGEAGRIDKLNQLLVDPLLDLSQGSGLGQKGRVLLKGFVEKGVELFEDLEGGLVPLGGEEGVDGEEGLGLLGDL